MRLRQAGQEWCDEMCEERRCPASCGLRAGHEGEHACVPPASTDKETT